MVRSLLALALLGTQALVNAAAEVETRTIDEIYQAALAEGGVVTLWHGGDELTQQNSVKASFEKKFPGMTLNVTVDLSKYHDGNLDDQLAAKNVFVDSIILQTLHDYPRWASEGALLDYAPLGYDQILPEFKNNETAAYYGMYIIAWAGQWHTGKLPGIKAPIEWEDWVNPDLKDKLVLTYPNDDDAVLFAFDLILKQYGSAWLDKLIALNPRWVRGTQTPRTILGQNGTQWGATFTSSGSLTPTAPINVSHPIEGQFVSWPQTGGILKDAPHPEGAKLLHAYLLSSEFQTARGGWSVRGDVAPPANYPAILDMPGTDPTAFGKWMSDRAAVERLRFWLEDRLGTAQGLSPLIDDL
ncbi:ABC-type Fe3+ transport system [Colletotrichum abscissum]|uniref:ABC-type Fe3+ transport system n=4 Tax=Colletotrichum acutatum species complex TaxID=2707335 RepID=A0A9Q0BAI7_9PEZI|nr:ABC-type Fe3+ transport system [Colletotrichum abscissum]KAK0368560.1 ABC-type Fe3+ transport system [Colletotrichum limetticola]KAK1449177.1 ABC-type Fe3+ transport system [Colletotrichum melonis]KAK1478484.1 ABC-type Fe3+ transport system [Colletotrichum cuscutae]KAI3558857.1 ABC-type Fe3+ transport system [Colletotrichum abscissum]KAK1471391.1 ABC-type Fe3+ transport system [Colletotrichum abscissum]